MVEESFNSSIVFSNKEQALEELFDKKGILTMSEFEIVPGPDDRTPSNTQMHASMKEKRPIKDEITL
jgi:hypothetical protein